MTTHTNQEDQFEAFTQLQPFHDATYSIELRRKARQASKQPEPSAGTYQTQTEFSQSQLLAVQSAHETIMTVVENPSVRALNILETNKSSHTE